MTQEWADCSRNNRARSENPSCIAPPSQVPKGRNNQEPGTEVPGTGTDQDESRKGRHSPTRNPCLLKASSHERVDSENSVPSLSGLVFGYMGSRHFRAGLLIVPSLRDLARRCNAAWIRQARAVCADSRATCSVLNYGTNSEGSMCRRFTACNAIPE
jgi:hypothetical protein